MGECGNLENMKVRKEIKLVLFYTLYIVLLFISDLLFPGGPCTPGLGLLFLILLIPISIILFFVDLYKFYRNAENSRLYCLLIHAVVWIGLFIFIKLS